MTTELISDELLVKVFDYVDFLPGGSIIIIAEIAKNDPQTFTQCLKQYIDVYHNADFNHDYTKFRKYQI